MKSLTIPINPAISPKYLQIADGLRTAIKQELLSAGEQLPSARKLALQLQTNRHTIMAACQELIAQGWLESVERLGYRVVETLPIERSLKGANVASDDNHSFKWQFSQRVDTSKTSAPAHEYGFNFTGGVPDVSLFPFDEFKSHVRDSLSRPQQADLHYGNPQGSERLIEQVSAYLRRVRSITDKELVVVNGSQEALYLIAHTLLNPGDVVAVESLGYRPAWQAFRAAGAELLGIKQHSQGLDIEHLKSLISERKIKLIYLTPLHQYPTTVTLPIAERMQIYALAAQNNVAIIEDDYDHEFHYDCQPLAPMAADDPVGLVIYLATFSKVLFPGCRLGVMAVDKALMPALLNYRKIISHKPNFLVQDALGRWMVDGGFERHLRRTTKTYQQRRNSAANLLDQYKGQGLPFDFKVPSGGMAFWIDIQRNATQLESKCLQHNIYLASEHQFQLKPSESQDRYIRLGFAGMEQRKFSEGLGRIVKLWTN